MERNCLELKRKISDGIQVQSIRRKTPNTVTIVKAS